MAGVVRTRWMQGYRTMPYPVGPAPALPERFAGKPALDSGQCDKDCQQACRGACPTGAITTTGALDAIALSLDTGKCLFCRNCQDACARGAITFSRNYQLAAAKRADLVLRPANRDQTAPALQPQAAHRFGRSLKLRQVSAAGCNACEADTNVLNTVAWDLGRFGIQFVASPRHADGLLITGPVSQNMKSALLKTYEAVPAPKVVIAVGACAISGGPYIDHREVCNGAADLLPVDLFIPGCPPHPLTILDGLLRFLGRTDGRELTPA